MYSFPTLPTLFLCEFMFTHIKNYRINSKNKFHNLSTQYLISERYFFTKKNNVNSVEILSAFDFTIY